MTMQHDSVVLEEMPIPKEQYQTRLPKDLVKWLRDYSEQTGLSQTELATRVFQWLKDQPQMSRLKVLKLVEDHKA